MCNEGSAETPPVVNNPLTGILTPNVAPLPKASLALGAMDFMKERHAKLTAKNAGTDENVTLHITSEAPYISSNSAAVGKAAGMNTDTVSVLGPGGALEIEVTPPSPTGTGVGIDFGDVFKFVLSVLPIAALVAGTNEPPTPTHIATFDAMVTGSTAQIVSHELGVGVSAASGVGIDIGCIVSAGGGTILSTIVRCLPAMANGLEAFKTALLAALGPAGVDLVSQLIKCF
jgi:hypothetical protein